MITRIISKKNVIEQLESLKSSAEYMSHKKDNNEMLVKDVIALQVAIDCIKKRRREDLYIIKATVALTIILVALILAFLNIT
jgi:hypothetical protein